MHEIFVLLFVCLKANRTPTTILLSRLPGRSDIVRTLKLVRHVIITDFTSEFFFIQSIKTYQLRAYNLAKSKV